MHVSIYVWVCAVRAEVIALGCCEMGPTAADSVKLTPASRLGSLTARRGEQVTLQATAAAFAVCWQLLGVTCHSVTHAAACRLDADPDDVLRALEVAKRQPPALAPLFACDQLNAIMRSCELHPLQHFQEHTPANHMPFPPTYKFQVGSEEYDSRRTPSWTDRILWRSNYHLAGREAVEAVAYACVPEMRQSDHRPVVATVVVQLKHSSKVTHDQSAGLEVGEEEDGAREGRARGRALRKWLGEATTRLRTLRGPVTGPIVADGDFAPFRHNAQMLRLATGGDEGCMRGSRSLPRTMRRVGSGGA